MMGTLIMKNNLKTLKETEAAIAREFGLDELWYGLNDMTDQRWTCYTEITKDNTDSIREFGYGYKTKEGLDDGDYYSIEVYGTSVWLSNCGNYVLTVGDNGCGDRDFYLFSMENNDDFPEE